MIVVIRFWVSKTHFQGTTILIENLVYLQEECLEGNDMFLARVARCITQVSRLQDPLKNCLRKTIV